MIEAVFETQEDFVTPEVGGQAVSSDSERVYDVRVVSFCSGVVLVTN